MEKQARSYVSKILYSEDKKSGIYPLSEIIKEVEEKRELLGGSPGLANSPNAPGDNARFEGLGVPVGLYIAPKDINFQLGGDYKIVSEDCDEIDDDLFDKLYNFITPIKTQKKCKKTTRKLHK
jgi:hypothetical protein